MADDATPTPLDKVTQLQELFDQLALGMFNALRLLPQDPSSKDTESMDVENPDDSKIKELSSNVLETVKSIDQLIDTLPGLSTSERYTIPKLTSYLNLLYREQYQELGRLQQCSDTEAEKLQSSTETVKRWIDAARASLRVVADDKLQLR